MAATTVEVWSRCDDSLLLQPQSSPQLSALTQCIDITSKQHKGPPWTLLLLQETHVPDSF
jgi:hypothetical protein